MRKGSQKKITGELSQKINEKFTEQVLIDSITTYYNLNNIIIEKINFGEESKKGDSYFSSNVKFTINATGINKVGKVEKILIPVFAKTLHKNLRLRKSFRDNDFFENEVIFYQKVWPEIKQFQESKNVNNPFENVPKLLACYSDGTNDFIALEDLCHKGFTNSQREKSLNYEHTSLIMKLFARFHGLSLAFKDQQPEKFEEIASNLKETYFSHKFRPYYCEFQSKLFEIVCDAIEKELPEIYLKKVKNLFSDDFFGKLCALAQIRGPLAVVTQGDAWIPNFLFKYGSKNLHPIEATLIDFQLSRYSTLTHDLTYFLYSCTDDNLREEYWDVLIEEYHSALCETLKSFGSDPNLITLDGIVRDMKENGVFGIGMVTETLTVSLMSDEDIFDIDNIEGIEAVPLTYMWRLQPFEDHEKRLRLANAFKHAVDYGIIR